MATKDDRTFIKLHDGMPEHPKVDGLSDRAFRALIESWCWCSRQLSDGYVPIKTWKKRVTPKVTRELTEAGLVEPVEGGFQMHDYLEHQRSKAQVEHIKEVRSEAGSKGGRPKANRKQAETKLVSNEEPKPNPETETETEEKTSSSLGREDDDAFEAFWAVYPRKVDKKPARQAWQRLVKAGTDPDTLIETAKRYAASRVGEPEKYTKHAKTWLNQASWQNEQERHLSLVDSLPDHDIDPDEVLGPDYWSPPAPPREIDEASVEERREWFGARRAERRQERVAEARRMLAARQERGTA